MKYVYPAVFTKDGDFYNVNFPDFEGCYTQGSTIEEAFELYIKAMNHVEGDKFYRTDCDGETINLTE